ncbi:MAG TPA: acyltransferase [Solirubrobacteraceae bacterium]|jgi:peptidoglycan/LPS O-acetylase OafA/YrhL
MPSEATPRTRQGAGRGERIPALDGLRGLAALVVLVHHTLLASVPKLAGVYSAGPFPRRGSFEWLLTYTPLHVVWAGQEFVVVFFVLSGFVLSLPAVGGSRLRVASYYPSRFVRLYLPVWGALALAAALHVAVSHGVVPGASWWLNAHSQPLSTEAVRQDAGLLSKHAGHWATLDVLWSLRWEVLFSAALPLLLALARWGRAREVLPLLCVAALAYHGSSEYLLELPPFVLGVALAFGRARIERLALALGARTLRNGAAKLALGAACVGGLTADWWIPGVDASAGSGAGAGAGVAAVLVACGACLAVVGALTVGSFAAVLRSRPMSWTGKRSYSLYLVHEPIVVAVAFAAGGRPWPLPYALAAVTLSLAGAAVFFRCVESPSHGFARRLGAYAGRDRRDATAGGRLDRLAAPPQVARG